jgi:ribosomal protein S18 acetylase RimI-like enzyme
VQPKIRPYGENDLDALYDICVRTADSGGDARGMYSTDRLMGDIFAAPYATHEPNLAHVVDDGGGRATGYILGTADTAAFARWYAAVWLPAHAYPEPHDPRDAGMIRIHEHPERMVIPELADYPAHLHIDLLPEFQGQGWGRQLTTAFLSGLNDAGVDRVHLGMATTNTGARAFYDRLGFHEIAVAGAGPITYLVRETYSPRR